MHPPPSRFVEHGDLTLAYREAGRGAPIVLLHGIGSSSLTWDRQFEGLSPAYRVIAWDAPGYGGSSILSTGDSLPPPRVEDYADALAGLFGELEIGSAHVVGHSMGGAIAAVFAARHSSRVRGLVLADSTRGGGVRPDEEREARLKDRLRALDELGPAGMARARAPRLVSAKASADLVGRIEAVMAEVRPEGYRQAAVMLSGTDVTKALRRVRAPTLVLCGEEDKITPVAESRAILDLLPDGRLKLIPDAGHAGHQEKPAAYNGEILAFLASADLSKAEQQRA